MQILASPEGLILNFSRTCSRKYLLATAQLEKFYWEISAELFLFETDVCLS